MGSESHRENILSGAYEEIGIGIVGGTPTASLPALSATYTTHFGARVRGPAPAATRASAAPAAPVRVRAHGRADPHGCGARNRPCGPIGLLGFERNVYAVQNLRGEINTP
ncbi:MAG: hypothetical protein M3376_12850 [Actinomycetota bacterium]|nr:hypothetical protein [Actinomycetota bacterium]